MCICRLFVKLLAAQEEIRERLADISVPLLIQQGTLDIPGMLEGSQELNERAASQDKTLSVKYVKVTTCFLQSCLFERGINVLPSEKQQCGTLSFSCY